MAMRWHKQTKATALTAKASDKHPEKRHAAHSPFAADHTVDRSISVKARPAPGGVCRSDPKQSEILSSQHPKEGLRGPRPKQNTRRASHRSENQQRSHATSTSGPKAIAKEHDGNSIPHRQYDWRACHGIPWATEASLALAVSIADPIGGVTDLAKEPSLEFRYSRQQLLSWRSKTQQV